MQKEYAVKEIERKLDTPEQTCDKNEELTIQKKGGKCDNAGNWIQCRGNILSRTYPTRW